jgi:hypothetical protein
MSWRSSPTQGKRTLNRIVEGHVLTDAEVLWILLSPRLRAGRRNEASRQSGVYVRSGAGALIVREEADRGGLGFEIPRAGREWGLGLDVK